MTTAIKRRTLVKSAAWVAPAVAATAAVPAYAASSACGEDIHPTRYYDSGLIAIADLANNSGNGYSAFIMNSLAPGDATLTGLPEGVTVTKLEMSFIFKTRDLSNNSNTANYSYRYGLPALNQAKAATNKTKYKEYAQPGTPDYRVAISADADQVLALAPRDGVTAVSDANAKKILTITRNNSVYAPVAPSSSSVSNVTYYDFVKKTTTQATVIRDLTINHPDGGNYNSWRIDFPAWVAPSSTGGSDGYRTGTYSTDSTNGCRMFHLTDFGEMRTAYNNAISPTYGDGTSHLDMFLRHRYTLSDGRVLIYDTWRTYYSPELPTDESRTFWEVETPTN